MFSPVHPIIANLFGRAPLLKMTQAPSSFCPSNIPKETSGTTRASRSSDAQGHYRSKPRAPTHCRLGYKYPIISAFEATTFSSPFSKISFWPKICIYVRDTPIQTPCSGTECWKQRWVLYGCLQSSFQFFKNRANPLPEGGHGNHSYPLFLALLFLQSPGRYVEFCSVQRIPAHD